MKKLLWFLVVLMLALPTAALGEMFLNASMEDDVSPADGTPDHWGAWGAGSSYVGDGWSVYRENDPLYPCYDGTDCGQLVGSDYALWVQAFSPITVGETYYYGFWVKDIAPVGSTVGIDVAVEYWDGLYDGSDFSTRGGKITTINDPRLPFGDSEWHYVETSFTVPSGVFTISPIPLLPGGGGDYLIDLAYMDTVPQTFSPVHTPDPVDTSSVSAGTTTLSWSRDDVMPGGGMPEVEIWWGTHDDPNFFVDATKIMNLADVSSLSLAATLIGSITLSPDTAYYWGAKYQDPDSPAGPLLENEAWSFDTINLAPVVEAGDNQSAWLDGIPQATVTLTGSATDDGLPTTPGSVSYTWLPTAGASFANTSDPTTNVTFTAAGTYTLTLEGYDGDKTGSDTVNIYVYAAATTGLIAHWPMDAIGAGSTVEDVIGTHDGDLIADATIDTADKQVGAGSLVLDGTDDYVEIPGSGTADPNFPTWATPLDPTVMSVSCWFKKDTGTTYPGLVHKGHSSWRLQLTANGDDIDWAVAGLDPAGAASGGAGTAAVTSIADGKWHHVVGVNLGNVIKIYIDGILAASEPTTGTPETGGYTLGIGRGQNNDNSSLYEFDGHIDEVKLYDLPLSPEKVLADFIADGGTDSCGGQYVATDITQDCYTNIEDVAAFVLGYMNCKDVRDPSCSLL